MSHNEIDHAQAASRLSRAGPRDLREVDFQTFTGAGAPVTRAQMWVVVWLAVAVLALGLWAPHGLASTCRALLFIGFISAAILRITAVFLAPAPAPTNLSAARLPTYTIIAPLYREAGMIGQLVQGLCAIDYPADRLQVLLALEADDLETITAAQAAVMPGHFEIVIVPPGHPRTKPRACNIALEQATGDYVAIYDAEDRPDPGQLREAAARFAAEPDSLACLQAPLRIDAGRRFLGRQFALEYALQFEVIIPVLARLGAAFPLGGTSNHFRAEALHAVGGLSPKTPTSVFAWRLGATG